MIKFFKKFKLVKLKYKGSSLSSNSRLFSAEPGYLNELRMDMFEDQVVKQNSDTLMNTGLKQIHLSGSPTALAELGRFLIGISETSHSKDYVSILGPIKGGDDNFKTQLMVHHAEVKQLKRIIRMSD